MDLPYLLEVYNPIANILYYATLVSMTGIHIINMKTNVSHLTVTPLIK